MSKVIVDEIQTDTSNGNVRIIPNGTGALEVKGAGGDDAILQLNCSAQSHGVKIKSPNHSAGQSYTMILPDNNIEAGKFLKVDSITGSGNNAVGQLKYADVSTGGGVSSDSKENTLGGTDAGTNLDLSASESWQSAENTFFGFEAGKATTQGYYNTYIGHKSGHDGTTSYINTYVGRSSGENNTGYENILIGYRTGADATTNNCTAIGNNAMLSASCANCTAVGIYTLQNVTGAYNTALGHYAGERTTSGENNLFLGYYTGFSSSPSGQITTGSNNVVLGNNSIQNLYCADTSISSSDARDKTDVTSFTIGLDWIEALRPVTYRWDRRTWYGTDEEPYGTPDGSKKRQRLHIGFLAQEALAVEQANGYGTNNDDSLILNLTDDGMSYGMKYERLVPILVNAIKELSARVKTLEGG